MLTEYRGRQIDRIILLLIYDFCIDLSYLDVGMTEQLAYGIEVCTQRQHHRGKGVARHIRDVEAAGSSPVISTEVAIVC